VRGQLWVRVEVAIVVLDEGALCLDVVLRGLECEDLRRVGRTQAIGSLWWSDRVDDSIARSLEWRRGGQTVFHAKVAVGVISLVESLLESRGRVRGIDGMRMGDLLLCSKGAIGTLRELMRNGSDRDWEDGHWGGQKRCDAKKGSPLVWIFSAGPSATQAE
jgi:hypothetical protein